MSSSSQARRHSVDGRSRRTESRRHGTGSGLVSLRRSHSPSFVSLFPRRHHSRRSFPRRIHLVLLPSIDTSSSPSLIFGDLLVSSPPLPSSHTTLYPDLLRSLPLVCRVSLSLSFLPSPLVGSRSFLSLPSSLYISSLSFSSSLLVTIASDHTTRPRTMYEQ